MTKPRKRKSGMNHTVSLTDQDWEHIGAWAAGRGKRAGPWFCECALNVDPFPEQVSARPLVLDAEGQRGLSRAMAAAAGDMHAGGEVSADLAGAMRALLEMRLRAMAGDGRRGQAVELLRRVLGDERAAIVAAAVLPETEETPESPDRPAGPESGKGRAGTGAPQADLFKENADDPAGGA